MAGSTSTYLSISFFLLFSHLLSSSFTDAATFEIRNQCPYTVWAAATPGGGRRLERGQSWFLNVNPGTAGARIWGRTNCNFDGSGRGRCQTGDCAGVLDCRLSGAKPMTLAEYTLGRGGGQDFFDISLIDGFNLPMDFIGCKSIKCSADIIGQCPNELRTPGGCRDPCTVFGGNQYCCTNGRGTCGPTNYSRFFKERCPTSYSYPHDDPTSTFSCPSGTNYRVVFCPNWNTLMDDRSSPAGSDSQ